VIETMLSKLFFSGGKVYKFYKWEKAFYGDLSEAGFREKFIREDFFWNNIMSPGVYKRLEVLKNEKGEDDLCIIMNKFENSLTFTDYIENKNLTQGNLKDFVKNIILKQREITAIKKNELGNFLSEDLKHIETGAIEDMKSWCLMSKDIKENKINFVAEKLADILETDEYHKWNNVARKSACIDGNGDNFIIEGGKILFIDIMPPKENWRVKDEVFNLARTAADIRALNGNNFLADSVYSEYAKITGIEVPEITRRLYETRAAMIQTAYGYILNQKDRAEKYNSWVGAL